MITEDKLSNYSLKCDLDFPETAAEEIRCSYGWFSFHVTELLNRQAQTDKQHQENVNPPAKKIDGNHFFLPISAASLK